MSLFKKMAAALSLAVTASFAQASVDLQFNTAGYEVFTFHLDTAETASFGLHPGADGAAIGLFDSTGALLVFAEHAINTNVALLNHPLAAGDYSVLVSSCCNFQLGMMPDSYNTTWDHETNGLFYYSPSATLAGIESALDAHPVTPRGTYYLNTDTTLQPVAVPEPGSLALFGICFGALGMVSRRNRLKQQAN